MIIIGLVVLYSVKQVNAQDFREASIGNNGKNSAVGVTVMIKCWCVFHRPAGLHKRRKKEYSVYRAWFSLNKSLYPRSTYFNIPLWPWKINK